MEINNHIKDDILVIEIDGDVEMTKIKSIKSELMKIVEDNDNDVDIDFSKVNYLDSSGIGVLLTISKMLKQKGKRLRLVHLSERLQRIVELSSLQDVIA